MATGLLETGPKLDWTRDNKIFDRYQIWKEKVELIFSSALEESSSKQKVSYLRYWMGEQGIPLVKKWSALGKLDFSSSEEDDLSSGYILQNYWNLLEAEFKPKGNKLLSVIELWTRSKQGSKTLNEWLTYVYNLVESCDYGDSSERIIRDVLIIGCNSDKAKDKIVRQGEKIKLQDVIEILQLEDSTRQTLTEMTSTTQKIHYASYEKKKGTGKKQKFQSNSNSSSSSSSGQKQDSTGSQKLCYRCSKNYSKGHEKVCKALNAKCNACGVEGHFEIACKKSGNFPKKSSSKFQKPGSTGRMNIASAVEESALQADFFDEKGVLKEYRPKSMYVLSGTSDDKPIMIEFGCGLTPISFDRKLTLQADTGADMNAINKKKIILPYFDRHKETILQTDASKKGFGAVILQEEQPIYYASRAVTSAEKNYQNLEREAQAAVWGMEKFHYFLYGRKFILQTDQKPLVSIFRKHMIDVSPRIQRITIRAWQYDFVPQHIPGRINVIADSLSRVTPLEFQDSNAEKDILAVNFLQYSSIEERERDEMLQETNKDEELQSLKHYISTGWPAKRSQIPVSLHPYWNFRDELTVESGILMKNSKVLIPESLKQKYLKQIHQGHQGIEACRSRAREFVFWVNINSDLKEMVEKCDICQSQQNSTTSVQKYVSEVPPHPWHTLGSDLFYFQRIDFLVVVDYFSKYLIVRKIPSSTSSAVIKELGMIFSEFGNPLVFRSDNGPCYSSQEFKFFMQNWLVEHRTSSPHYPQSNGLAESMVKVSKNLIEKAIKQDLPWNRLLLDYRCTPISSEIPSPAEILFGRKFRSSISILPSQVLNDRISKQRELIAKKEGKFYASTQDFQDRIKALPFEAGQNVWLQNSDSRKFEEAVIREKCKEPNSYMVEIPATGQCFRRNSNFIKPRQTNKNSVSTDPLPTTGLPEIPQEPPVLQQPSSQATSTVDAIPTVPPSKQNDNSTPRTPRTPRQPRASRRSTKGIPPPRLGLQE